MSSRSQNHLDSEEKTKQASGARNGETVVPEKRTPLSRRQRIFVTIFGILLATGVACLLAELVLRIYWQPPEYSWFPRYSLRPDPFTGARYAPNLDLRISYSSPTELFHFTTNSLGFRSRELPNKKDPETIRVLFVGDSFTEGFGVNDEETFPYYFEHLARELELPVEVMNAGQNATDIPEHAAFMRGYAKSLKPDLVILSLYAGNDIPIEGPPNPPPRFGMSYGFRVSRKYKNRVRSIRPDTAVREDPKDRRDLWILAARPKSFGARLDRWLHRKSLFYRLTTEQLVLRLPPVRGFLKSLGWIELLPNKGPVVLGAAKAQMFLKEPQPDVEQCKSESIEQLHEIRQICEDLDVPVFVQVIPYIPTIPRFEPLWNWLWPQWTDIWEERLGREPTLDDFDRDLPNKRLRGIVMGEGFPCLDLEQIHENATRFDEYHQLTFKASLGHFTPEENLFDAGLLMHELLSRGLLSGGDVTGEEALVALETLWRDRYSEIAVPFAGPTTPSLQGFRAILDGFDRARVESSLPGIAAEPSGHLKQGFFTPVFDVRPDVKEVARDDYIECRFDLARDEVNVPATLVVDVCLLATDPQLHRTVVHSVWWGNRQLWQSAVEAFPQGRWITLEIPLPPVRQSTRLAIRAEATQDFDFGPVPSGEFPLVLRLRRLRVVVPVR